MTGDEVLELLRYDDWATARLLAVAALLLRQLGERGVHLDLATFLRERAQAAGR
jgi:hypothetical protein